MGYAKTLGSSLIQVWSDMNLCTATTVAGTKGVGYMVIPQYTGVLIYATLDMYIFELTNTNANPNYLTSGNVEFQDVFGTGYKTAISSIPSPLCHIAGSDFAAHGIIYHGQQNLKNYVNPTYPTGTNIRWLNVAALGNNLEFYACCCLNIYFQ